MVVEILALEVYVVLSSRFFYYFFLFFAAVIFWLFIFYPYVIEVLYNNKLYYNATLGDMLFMERFFGTRDPILFQSLKLILNIIGVFLGALLILKIDKYAKKRRAKGKPSKLKTLFFIISISITYVIIDRLTKPIIERHYRYLPSDIITALAAGFLIGCFLSMAKISRKHSNDFDKSAIYYMYYTNNSCKRKRRENMKNYQKN